MICFGVAAIVVGRKRSIFRALKGFVQMPILTPIGLMMANSGVFGLNLVKVYERAPELAIQALDRALAGVEAGALRPVVGKTFPMDRVGDAHEYLMSRANIGKVVLTNFP
jgi:synaptic vesicle membrane protein VAT-1